MADDNAGAEDALARLSAQMKTLDGLTLSFGRSLSGALASGVVQGRRFEDVLRSLGQRLIEIGFRAALRPVDAALGSAFEGLLRSAGGAGSSGFAGLFGLGQPLDIRPVPFAEGGIVSSPGMFPLGRGLGLAGERGAEAILPLQRGSDGRLGVAAAGGGGANVNVTIVTQDVASFRRSEVQLSSALARAVARGQRGL